MQNIKHPVDTKHFIMENNFAVTDTYTLQYTQYQVI